MQASDIVSAASSIVTAPLTFLYVAILTLEWRFPARVMRLLIPGFLALLCGWGAAYFAVCGVNEYTKITTAIVAVASFILFNIVCARYPLLQMCSTYATAGLFSFVSDTICGILVPGHGLDHVLAKVAVFLAVAALLAFFFRRPLLDVQREVQRKKWLWMMLVPMLMCVVFFYVVQMQGPLYADPAFRPVVLALCFCVVCVYVSFYFVFSSLQKQFRIHADYDLSQIHISALKKHAETMQTMSGQLRLFQHDLRHYVRMQSVCLESGDIEGAKKTLCALSQHLEDASGGRRLREYTGSALIDAVLSYYADGAQAQGIAVRIRIEPPGEEDASELAVVLSNALENALNACRAMDRQSAREIRALGGTQGAQYVLEIANTFAGEIRFDSEGRPAAREAGHGYGTQSIAAYARKRGALLFYEARDGWFSLRLLLPARINA